MLFSTSISYLVLEISSWEWFVFLLAFFLARSSQVSKIQTESPYFLPKPEAPAPFTTTLVGKFRGDPNFSDCARGALHCAAAWGLRIISSNNVHVTGAGLYNWFQDYIQPCVQTQDCQQRVVQIVGGGSIWLYNLYTVGTVEMINGRSGPGILAKDNSNSIVKPWISVINAWLLGSGSR